MRSCHKLKWLISFIHSRQSKTGSVFWLFILISTVKPSLFFNMNMSTLEQLPIAKYKL